MDIRPIRSEADYDWALAEIERYFEQEPVRGTADADRFDVLRAASLNPVEHYKLKVGLLRVGDPADFITFGSFDDLRFADVNGDGLTDAVRVATTFHQESFGTATIFETKSSVSYSARQPFADERMYSRAAQGSPDAMIRLAPLGRFDGKPGADLLQWRADRRLDLQSGVIEPALLHSYDDGVTKNEMY